MYMSICAVLIFLVGIFVCVSYLIDLIFIAIFLGSLIFYLVMQKLITNTIFLPAPFQFLCLQVLDIFTYIYICMYVYIYNFFMSEHEQSFLLLLENMKDSSNCSQVLVY